MFSKLILLLLACSCGITNILAIFNVTILDMTKNCACGIEEGGVLVQVLNKPCPSVDSVFWEQDSHSVIFATKYLGTVSKYNMINGLTITLYFKELKDQGIASVYPIHERYLQYIVAANHTLYLLKIDYKGLDDVSYTIKEVMKVMNESHVFTTSKTTIKGDLIIGTAPSNWNSEDVKHGEGQLLRVNMTSQKVETIDTGFDYIGGIAFDNYYQYLYVSDGIQGKIWQYQHNITTGKISDKKLIFDVKQHIHIAGQISAITMDREGRLWIGMIGSFQILTFDIRLSQIIHKTSIPASTTSSLTWGGKHHDILFVGTTQVNHEREPASGTLIGISGTGNKGSLIPRVVLNDKNE